MRAHAGGWRATGLGAAEAVCKGHEGAPSWPLHTTKSQRRPVARQPPALRVIS